MRSAAKGCAKRIPPSFRRSSLRLLGGVLLLGLCVASAQSPRALLLDAAVAGDRVFAVGERGLLVQSPDSGRTWSRLDPPSDATLTALSFAPDRTQGWIVAHDATILASDDGGRTWRKQWQGANLEDSFLDVLALSAQHAIAVGAYGLYLETHNSGATWQRRTVLDEDMHLNRITRTPDGILFLAGERGTLLRSRDSGRTWEPLDSPYDGSLYGVLALGGDSLLLHGLRGHVFRSDDSGETWSAVPLDRPLLISTAVRTPAGEVLLAGQAGALQRSEDGGQRFVRRDSDPDSAIAELVVAPDGTILAVGEEGALPLPR